jgi:hypothetical protein
MVRKFIIILSLIFSFLFNSPIELTEFEIIVLKIINNPDLYIGHISFQENFFNSSIISLSQFVMLITSILNVELNTALILLFFISHIISCYFLTKIVDCVFIEKNNRYIGYVIVCCVWLCDFSLVGVKWQFSTLNDEVRHYIIGLPILLYATYLYLINYNMRSIIVWTIIPWVSFNTFLIGAPLGLVASMNHINFNSVKSISYLLLSYLPIGFFLFLKFPIESFSESKSEWWYSLVFMPKHDSYFYVANIDVVGINQIPGGFSIGGILSLMLYIYMIIYVRNNLISNNHINESNIRKIIELALYSSILFVICILFNDVIGFRFLIGREILVKVFWYANIGALFVYLVFALNHSSNNTFYLASILFLPWYKWPDGYWFYVLFLSAHMIDRFFYRENQKLNLLSIFLPICCLVIILASVKNGMGMPSISALIILSVFILFQFKIIDNKIIRMAKGKLVLINPTILILTYILFKSAISLKSTITSTSFIDQTIETDFQDICLKINEIGDDEVVMIPPGYDDKGYSLTSTYYMFSNNPVLSYYYPTYLLASEIIPLNDFVKTMTKIWGDDIFYNAPKHYRDSSTWLLESMKDKWRYVSNNHLQKLKQDFNLKLIVRENTLPIDKPIIYKNSTYTLYNIE